MGSLKCEKCSHSYPIIDGIHYFSKSNFYYSDLDTNKMDSLITDCLEVGWERAVFNKFQNDPFVLRIITDETRADWQYLLPINKEMIALDIGAGWGTISIPLARNIKHLYALEGTLDRLQFLNIRADQQNINNITSVYADILNHPFPKGGFDLISFNGVLEWVGMDGENVVDPKEKQLQALKIAFDLLKEDGYLYIGIENSQGIKYVLGEPDDHTGIKYITYLDRTEANEISNKTKGYPYRTYTYSKKGYEELLNGAGFCDISFYYPDPDYKQIESLHDLKDSNVSMYINDTNRYLRPSWHLDERVSDMERLFIQSNNLWDYAASYSIIARKVGNK